MMLRQPTRPHHAKAYFPNFLVRFARHSVPLRTRTQLAQYNGAPDQNSSSFLLAGDERPLLPLQANFRGEEFRPAAPVVEAPLAMRPAIGRSCAPAKCTGRRVR